jgi:hypothetical protein
MTPRLTTGQNEQFGAENGGSKPGWLSRFDRLGALPGGAMRARWANRALLIGLALFALTVPHSIAAAQISFGMAVVAWLARDLFLCRFHFARTPIDRPLLCFTVLTVLSALFSLEPDLSLPKLRGLSLFVIIYLFATNLHRRGVRFFAALLIASSLAGVGYSLIEKAVGRGMVIAAISADSPLAASQLQTGDVIWMVARRRVSSLEEAARIIRRHRAGETLEIEAIHAGDPLPVKLLVTDEVKAQANPLGISVGGRSRRFRVSGFTRHFITYAEQMQMLALLVYGALLAGWRMRGSLQRRFWLLAGAALFVLFSLTLALTASRAVIASFLLTLVMLAVMAGGRRAVIPALLAAVMIGGVAMYTLVSSRTLSAISFSDDSSARRIGYMRAGLRLIPRHPLLGSGLDAHKRHWTEWGFPGDYVTHTHSTPIQIAMDRGLPALGCYLWLMAAMLALMWRGYARARKEGEVASGGLMLGAFAALIGFSASSLVNYNFGDSETLMLLLCVVGLAMAGGASRELPDAAPKTKGGS